MFASVAVGVFGLLSLIGGLVAPAASADDDTGIHEPTQDVQNPSEWESCGENCIVPEFICPPGHNGPGEGPNPTCEATAKFGAVLVDDLPGESIECPDGQYVAFEVQLNAESIDAPGPPLDSQFCTEPTADLLFGFGLACPAGYTSGPNGPFVPTEEFPLEPTAEEIDARIESGDISARPDLVPMVPTATPVPRAAPTDAPAMAPTPAPGLPVAIPIPDDVPPPDEFFPTCTGPDGDVAGAIISGIWGPAPFEPGCPDGARLWSGPDGIFCRSEDGVDSDAIVVPFQAPDCGPDEIEVGEAPYTSCMPTTVPAFPVCPIGYTQYAESFDSAPICTNDEELIGQIVALPVGAPDCGVACESAVAEAAADAANAAAETLEDEGYASYPSCPDFAQLADGTCANIISGSAPAGTQEQAGATAGNISGNVTHTVVQQPVVIQPVVQPVSATPVVTHAASNYGFGASLPTVATSGAATTAKLAHTGTETNTFLYVALSMIAAGAVAMGSRRREDLRA